MSKNKKNNSKGCSFLVISLIVLIGILTNIDTLKSYTFIIILIGVLVAIFLYFFITSLINDSSKKKEIEELISKERDERRKYFLTGLALKYNKESEKEICINTELSDSQRESYKILYSAFEELCTCDKTWFIVSRTANNENKSSASYNVNRRMVTFTKSTFNQVFVPDTHFVPTLTDGINTKYYIYPTCIVKAKGEKDFEIINLIDVKVKFATQDFVEDTYEFNQPNDSKIIRFTYRKVNKDGSPDLRFNNNKKLPVYEYGIIKIDRLGITFMASNIDKTRAFVSAFAEYKAVIANTQKQTMPEVKKNISKEISDRLSNEELKDAQNDSEKSNNISNIENNQHDIKELESQIIAIVKLLLQNNHVSQRYLSEKTGINISQINIIDGYLYKMGITDSSGKLLIHSESDLKDILKKVTGDQFYFQKRELTKTTENISEIKRLINKTKDEKYILFYQGYLLSEEKKRNSILIQLGIPNTDEISFTKPINGRIENECIIIDSNLSQEECILFRRFCESSYIINDVYSIGNKVHLNSSPILSSEIKRDFAMFSTLNFNNILQSECFKGSVPNIFTYSINLFWRR